MEKVVPALDLPRLTIQRYACWWCDRTSTDDTLLTIVLPFGKLACPDCRDLAIQQ
jgi:hypothetical protein